MPTRELIQPIVNREFQTGPGSWAGDFTWSPDTLYGREGYIYIDTPWPGPQKIISLPYPYVRPPKNDVPIMVFSLAQVLPYSGYVTFDYFLTDGVYSIGPPDENFGFSPFWELRSHVMATPPDWNILNSSLVVRMAPWLGASGRIALRNFSLTQIYFAKTDHLPLIGVH